MGVLVSYGELWIATVNMTDTTSGENFLGESTGVPSDPVSGQELARAVLTRRRIELGLTQDQVYERSGISTTTQSKIERGRGASETTLRRLDLALDWPAGTCKSYYQGRGGVLTPSPHADAHQLLEELAPMVSERLRAQREVVSVAGLPPAVVVALERLIAEIATLCD